VFFRIRLRLNRKNTADLLNLFLSLRLVLKLGGGHFLKRLSALAVEHLAEDDSAVWHRHHKDRDLNRFRPTAKQNFRKAPVHLGFAWPVSQRQEDF
jgi:hypothetical protein